MQTKFRVTYEIVTPESAENGEAEELGFISKSCDLREAIDLVGGAVTEANEWPVRDPRWLTNHEYNHDYATGGQESRSLHFPDHVTAASRRRIARLLGCYGV